MMTNSEYTREKEFLNLLMAYVIPLEALSLVYWDKFGPDIRKAIEDARKAFELFQKKEAERGDSAQFMADLEGDANVMAVGAHNPPAYPTSLGKTWIGVSRPSVAILKQSEGSEKEVCDRCGTENTGQNSHVAGSKYCNDRIENKLKNLVSTIGQKYGTTIADVKKSLAFDAHRVGAPGSPVRRQAAFLLELLELVSR